MFHLTFCSEQSLEDAVKLFCDSRSPLRGENHLYAGDELFYFLPPKDKVLGGDFSLAVMDEETVEEHQEFIRHLEFSPQSYLFRYGCRQSSPELGAALRNIVDYLDAHFVSFYLVVEDDKDKKPHFVYGVNQAKGIVVEGQRLRSYGTTLVSGFVQTR